MVDNINDKKYTGKMYILIRDDIDNSHAVLASAHAALSGYLTFIDYEYSTEYKNKIGKNWKSPTPTELWVKESFRKVICRVNINEFNKAKNYGENMKDYRIMVESGLGGIEVAIVFSPKEDWSPFFKSLKLY